MILLYLLGYAWSALTTIPGALLFVLAKLAGAVVSTTISGPALLVRLNGRWADWMQTPNAQGYTMYGHTVGPFIFAYCPLEEQQSTHEKRHVYQQMFLGPFHIVIYVVSFLYGLIRYRNSFTAYRACVLERDARRIAGEEE